MSWLGPLTPPESEVAMLGAVTDVQPFRLTERPGRAVLVRGGRGGEMQTDWLSDGGALRGDEMMRRLGAERCSSWVSPLVPSAERGPEWCFPQGRAPNETNQAGVAP